jgi:hypothetical protein
MKNALQSLKGITLLGVFMAFTVVSLQAQPNSGWTQYSSSYTVQNWTNQSLASHFNYTGGVYNITLKKGDWSAGVKGRVEMRWNNWPAQTAENMINADVMYESGTNGSCIMQIKTNTGTAGHEAVYLQVLNNGTLYNGGGGTALISGGFGKYNNIKAAYNPRTGLARVWINNALKLSKTYPAGSGAVWYFKNGCYGATATSKVHFKNITFWRNPATKSAIEEEEVTGTISEEVVAAPNPVVDVTTISYGLTADADVTVKVFDITGSVVATLVKERQEAGSHSCTWDATSASAGTYFVQVIYGQTVKTAKLVKL